MIICTKDKFLEEIIAPINQMEHISNIKSAKDLHIYGVSSERDYDFVIPEQLINSRRFVDSLSNIVERGIKIGCYWGQAKSYDFNCLGLGYIIRDKHKDDCRKMIISLYLWINEKIDHGKIFL